jgi:hypothetical protein
VAKRDRILRHGECAGNVARAAAYRAGLARIELDTRDIDVPLSPLGEQQILEIDRTDEVANCSITRYAFDPAQGKRGKLILREYNTVVPLLEEGAPITAEPHVRTPTP